MAKEGGVILHRKLIDSYAFANEKTLKIWIWLLLKAKWKKGYFDVTIGNNKKTLYLERGQLIFGRLKASEELSISASTIERHLENLVEEKQIIIKKTANYSIITVKNYNDYQVVATNGEPPVNTLRTTGEPPVNTYNNVNKVNKVNKDNNITLSGEKNEIDEPIEPEQPKHPIQDLSNSNLYRQPNIPTEQKVLEVFSFQGGTKEMADRFFEVMSAVGWFYKNSPVVDFTFLVPKFIAAWKNNLIPDDKFRTNGTYKNRTNQQLEQREWLADEKRKALEAVGLNGNGSFTG